MSALLLIFISSFFIALSGAVMPGPLLTATIHQSALRGPSAGPLLIVGHGILELILVVLLLLGAAPLLQQDRVFGTVALIGGLFMAFMAVQMFRALPGLSLQRQPPNRSYGKLLFTGAFMSLANPYWTIWWATIGVGYVVRSMDSGIPGAGAFYTGHILGDLGWYAFISYSVAKGKKLLNDKLYRLLIGICAGLLLFFAGFFFLEGLKSFNLY